MSDDSSEATSIEILSDQQRIELLEKAGKLNRLVIYILAGVLALVLLAGLTVGLLSFFDDSDEMASLASVEALQHKVGALEQQLSSLQLQVQDQEKLLALKSAPPPLPAATPPAEVTAPATTTPAPVVQKSDDGKQTVQQVAKMLLGQEQSYQEALAGLKIGMTDLAGMIAGSRSWVDYYTESVDKQIAASRARIKNLQQWYTAEMKDDQ